MRVTVGAVCLVNEFHDPHGDFHQADVYFRCTLTGGDPYGDWTDPEGVVSMRRWVTKAEIEDLNVKPDSLAAVAWSTSPAAYYDPLEPIVR